MCDRKGDFVTQVRQRRTRSQGRGALTIVRRPSPPSAERRVPSADHHRRAPSAECRVPSAERRAPSTERWPAGPDAGCWPHRSDADRWPHRPHADRRPTVRRPLASPAAAHTSHPPTATSREPHRNQPGSPPPPAEGPSRRQTVGRTRCAGPGPPVPPPAAAQLPRATDCIQPSSRVLEKSALRSEARTRLVASPASRSDAGVPTGARRAAVNSRGVNPVIALNSPLRCAWS